MQPFNFKTNDIFTNQKTYINEINEATYNFISSKCWVSRCSTFDPFSNYESLKEVEISQKICDLLGVELMPGAHDWYKIMNNILTNNLFYIWLI